MSVRASTGIVCPVDVVYLPHLDGSLQFLEEELSCAVPLTPSRNSLVSRSASSDFLES